MAHIHPLIDELPTVHEDRSELVESHPNILPSSETEAELEALSPTEKEVLLGMAMESIRGAWGSPNEQRVAVINWLCAQIDTLPEHFLSAVHYNNCLFYENMSNGKVFTGPLTPHTIGPATGKAGQPASEEAEEWDGSYHELWELTDGDVDEDLARFLPGDLTFSDPADEPPDPPENHPQWSAIENNGQNVAQRCHKIIHPHFGDETESQMPLGLTHIIHTEDGTVGVVGF